MDMVQSCRVRIRRCKGGTSELGTDSLSLSLQSFRYFSTTMSALTTPKGQLLRECCVRSLVEVKMSKAKTVWRQLTI